MFILEYYNIETLEEFHKEFFSAAQAKAWVIKNRIDQDSIYFWGYR